MELQQRINQQRIQFIIDSYQLAPQDSHQSLEAFTQYLNNLLEQFPPSLMELALVETLADLWSEIPLPRGCQFLEVAHAKLKKWESQPVVSSVTPSQYEQVAGLNAVPVFGEDTPLESAVTMPPL